MCGFTDQEECSAVVVLLQELVLALRRFVGDELWIQFLFLSPFFLRHVVESFQLLLLFLESATHFSMSTLLYARLSPINAIFALK